jgi:hypothetical protein
VLVGSYQEALDRVKSDGALVGFLILDEVETGNKQVARWSIATKQPVAVGNRYAGRRSIRSGTAHPTDSRASDDAHRCQTSWNEEEADEWRVHRDLGPPHHGS